MKKTLIPIWLASVVLASTLVAQPTPVRTFRDNSTQLKQLLDDSIAQGDPGAAIMVLHDGQVVAEAYRGMANLATGARIDEHTRFYIASVAKTFTATAILLLGEQGKLRLEDRLTTYFPDLPPWAKDIRIYHLLTHTSGLPDSAPHPAGDAPVTNSHVIQFVRSLDSLAFEPGVDYEYSNVAYVLLATIVEKASGTSYREFVTTSILEPLGMKETVIYDETRPAIPNRVVGYELSDGKWIVSDYGTNNLGTGPGGMFSTLRDLHLWLSAIEERRILKPRSWALALHMPIVLSGAQSWMAMGWFNETLGPKTPDVAGIKAYGAIGVLFGFRSMMEMFPDEHLSFIILSNAGTFPFGGAEVARTYLGANRGNGDARSSGR